MILKLTRNDLIAIYDETHDLYRGVVMEEPLEERIEREYDTFGVYYIMPYMFECNEVGKTVNEALDPIMGKDDEYITQEEFVQAVAALKDVKTLEEDEEVVEVPAPEPTLTPVAKPKPHTARSGKSDSLSAKARDIYAGLFDANPNIRNVDAQRQIAEQLGIVEKKQLNSLRALIVKFKKQMA